MQYIAYIKFMLNNEPPLPDNAKHIIKKKNVWRNDMRLDFDNTITVSDLLLVFW